MINPADGKTIKELKGHQGRIGGLAYSPKDGNVLFSASADKTAKLWDVNQGKSLRDFNGHADAVISLNVSRDGAKIVTGSNDQTARVWNVADGKIAGDAFRARRSRSRRYSCRMTTIGSPRARLTSQSDSGSLPGESSSG